MKAFQQSYRRMAGQALNILLPPRCVVSGDLVDRQGMVASHVWAALNFITDPYCECCGMPFEFKAQGPMTCAACLENPPGYHKARAALKYDDTSRDLILGFKHADKTHAVKAFSPWLMRAGQGIVDGADYIIPIPLHRWRLIKRRYNQAALIALELSRQCGVPCLPDGLKRTRATKSQGHMKEEERKKNVSKAFAISKKYENTVKGASILLIDDVYTTGATVRECAKTLTKAGAGRVSVLTLAKVVKN